MKDVKSRLVALALVVGMVAAGLGCADNPNVKRDVGAVAGAVGGGVLGSQFGRGSGKVAATIGGAVLGGLLGGYVGQQMDQNDRYRMNRAFENNRDGETLPWRNDRTGGYYETTPKRTYQTASGDYCREFTQTADIGGRKESVYGTACRQPDGSWKVVN